MSNPTAMRVSDPGIRALFTIESRWQAWLDVEVALARAEGDLGVIPAEAVPEIAKKANLKLMDRARIDEGLRRTAHPIVPLVWELSRICDGDAGHYVHWGATTQNIVQTGDLLILRKVHGIFLQQFAAILREMADLAERTKDMALPGRTHGQHAVPATFGLKVGNWIDEMCRHVERLHGVEPRIFRVLLGGAAGTMASFDGKGMAIQAGVAKYLNMIPMAAPARTIGDHQAEYITILGLIAATAGKIGREIYTLMKQEFGEVEEPVPPGTVGSSTMPQKRNPKLSQDVIAASAEIRALVPLALESMMTEHEADRANALMIQHATEQGCIATGDMLSRIHMMIAGLTVNPERMRRNLDLSGGMIMGEALMLSLGARIGRQEAHDAIYDAAQAAATTGESFEALLAKNETVKAHMKPAQITELLDPTTYTGECAAIAAAQAEQGRKVAAEIESGR